MGRSSRGLDGAVVAGILVCVAAVSTGGRGRVTANRITFPGYGGSVELSGVIYRPGGYDAATASRYSAVVMMHGCSGIWSERVVGNKNPDGTPNLQKNIEKWGIKLAESNVVALAVDSFTPRQPSDVASSEEWQNQCSDNAGRYAGAVDPYTERVHDARAAWEFLNAMPEIDSTRIGLLGWSHGAQSGRDA
jgi:dienelactone hydrolase